MRVMFLRTGVFVWAFSHWAAGCALAAASVSTAQELASTAHLIGKANEAVERFAPGTTFRDCEENDTAGISICPAMVVVPAGSFTMGSYEAGAYDRPPHKVTIAQPFAVGQFEVTFAEWDACVAGGGCQSNKNPSDEGWGRGKRPVIHVSWNDAKEYVAWLSKKTGKAYRLLTEAEWEYAARAGTTTTYAFGDTITKSQAWFSAGAYGRDGKTIEVGSFKPNAFGLYDMHGNVEEWVEDCDHMNYYNAPADGSAWTSDCYKTGPDKIFERVLRGGQWNSGPEGLRSANRGGTLQIYHFMVDGFRLARTLHP